MLSRTVENAQKKVEQQNFLIRKRVLEYDDVMNEQRRVVYKYRREILEGRDMSEVARAGDRRGRRADGRGVHGRARSSRTGTSAAFRRRPPSCGRTPVDLRQVDTSSGDREEIAQAPHRGRARRLREARGGARRRVDALPRAPDPAPDHRQPLERAPLRDGLHAGGDPPPRVRADRPAGRLQERGLHDVPRPHELHLGGVRPDHLPRRGQHRAGGLRAGARALPRRSSAMRVAAPTSPRRSGRGRPGGDGPGRPLPPPPRARPPSAPRPLAATAAASENPETVVKSDRDKIGRNDPCWCGSGKKYKKCHGA